MHVFWLMGVVICEERPEVGSCVYLGCVGGRPYNSVCSGPSPTMSVVSAMNCGTTHVYSSVLRRIPSVGLVHCSSFVE